MRKKVQYLVFLLLIHSSFQAARRTTMFIEDLYKKVRIVPDLIPFGPDSVAQVTYPFGKLKPGMNLTVKAASKQPKVTWRLEANSYYTLFLTGFEEPKTESEYYDELTTALEPEEYNPDAESISIRIKEWQQWLVINIPGRNISQGLPLYEYLPPHPPDKPDSVYIYTFLVYQQVDHIIEYCLPDSSGFFSLDMITVGMFIDGHNLGDPIAGNFFYLHYTPGLNLGPPTHRPPATVRDVGRENYKEGDERHKLLFA